MIPRMRRLAWRTAVRRAAEAQGFLDPIALLARLQQFAQPSEVHYPVELLRAGAEMHARGLLNARIIQHNMDWRWPLWVRRQYDPRDISFVPRAFSLTHVNLTHRNWTALGIPGVDAFPIVDPAGLLTPLHDGWSVDVWVRGTDERWLVPASAPILEQHLDLTQGLSVVTHSRDDDARLALTVRATAFATESDTRWELFCEAGGDAARWLVIALRPCNPEGISAIRSIALDGTHWRVDEREDLYFDTPPAQHLVGDYGSGDVHTHWDTPAAQSSRVRCPRGMATAAAVFPLDARHPRRLRVQGILSREAPPAGGWAGALSGVCRLQHPDAGFQHLYDAAVRTLVLLTPSDPYPGPYTYRRFWFRDAVFILDALLALGLVARVDAALARFRMRQSGDGYFRSQDGEWDSNGQVLWLFARHAAATQAVPDAGRLRMLRAGAEWILRKRLPRTLDGAHAGLMPAGFSAEHLGPNDYYYWDDFWSVAGLRAAATLFDAHDAGAARRWREGAEDFMSCIDRSLEHCRARLGRPAMPAAPYRRLDAGAIGSIVAGHPLQLLEPLDPRLLDTVEYLLERDLVDGGFFQQNIHSGINAYLTLHLAQVLMRAGDARQRDLIAAVARLASPTGQWPEAVHPQTGGGCMGDGQHAWAAAEWVMALRNACVREEDGLLVIGSGVADDWLADEVPLSLGPTPTSHGPLSVIFSGPAHAPRVSWQAQWHRHAPTLRIAVPGHAAIEVPGAPPVGTRVLGGED
ncbi:MAG TPA: hypothetical protein PJ986_11305 [Gammaproteobacteria bacterium]|nr:hypothetical protein [Gammaproteobacteria bacterium]